MRHTRANAPEVGTEVRVTGLLGGDLVGVLIRNGDDYWTVVDGGGVECSFSPDGEWTDVRPLRNVAGELLPAPDECGACGVSLDDPNPCPAQGADDVPHRHGLRIGRIVR